MNNITKQIAVFIALAGAATLFLAPSVIAKPVQIKKPVKLEPTTTIKTYAANNNLPASRLMTIKSAIKRAIPMRLTEVKLTTYEEFAAKTGEYKSAISTNRMVWIVTGFVPGEFRMSGGSSICTDNAKIVEVIDAETGDILSRPIYCPPENTIDYMRLP
ncbi:hypothetical protein DSM106972_039810 [Dulcicalothrix desertica PCC 7102]|uniref:Uncharacterized protein n=1 Tax=Dulcicalothrix desertica PCC 7102 TaxID=232991 RepID=A0A3S1IZS7_9CYAN|nr:hypothetical protein [Dulcicalothrix desertica]RUT05160.1 hypothetical protein DSM106972_039810 [Dulcicalothrix desertica PCC 7102]TWH43333.1 hypothetical protein CAL7102_07046 [Dulcicalothrix desertica PCC 7102]